MYIGKSLNAISWGLMVMGSDEILELYSRSLVMFHYTWRALQMSFREVVNSWMACPYCPIWSVICVIKFLAQSVSWYQGANYIRKNKMQRKLISRAHQVYWNTSQDLHRWGPFTQAYVCQSSLLWGNTFMQLHFTLITFWSTLKALFT